jgi:tetratricopeptide (TPR) repeat protein
MSSSKYLHIGNNYDISELYKLKTSNNYYSLGLYHQFVSYNYDLMKKYYKSGLKTIDKSDILNNLGFYYIDIEKKYDFGVKYYLESIKLNNIHAMNNLGMYYYNIEKNYILAKKYYQMACDNNLVQAYNNMALYFYEIDNNYQIAKLYFIESIISDINNIENITNVKKNMKHIYTPLERYIWFLQNSINIDKNEEDEFNKDEQIIIFKNRLNLFGKFEECCICMVDYTVIPLECTHYICVDCYPKIINSAKCPLCRTNINS